MHFGDRALEVHLSAPGAEAVHQELVDKRPHFLMSRTGHQLANDLAQAVRR
jgi:hypothetical protein